MSVLAGEAFGLRQVHDVVGLTPQPDGHNLQFIPTQDEFVPVEHLPNPQSQPEQVHAHAHGSHVARHPEAVAFVGPAAADQQQHKIGKKHLPTAPLGRFPADFPCFRHFHWFRRSHAVPSCNSEQPPARLFPPPGTPLQSIPSSKIMPYYYSKSPQKR